MSNSQNDKVLDKKSRERLDKLIEQWNGSSGLSLNTFTTQDLRLLLEHFPPLHQLIREIVSAPAVMASVMPTQKAAALNPPHLPEVQAVQLAAEHALTQAKLKKAEAECVALGNDLKECSATVQGLRHDKEALQEELRICRLKLQQTPSTPVELTFLRANPELAQRLDLADLAADDRQALIQVVAVLAQRDSLERLWIVLKECCETDRRAANDAERELLSSALGWYNHNWRTRPYRLNNVAARSPYNFEQHQRSQHTVSGEKIHETLLPGIADGTGKILCKTLVSTF